MFNKCKWLTIQSTQFCSKNCINEYCAIHRSLMRKGRRVPLPCQVCGKGTQSETRKCKHCGGNYSMQKLNRINRKSRKNYELVLKELKFKVRIEFYFEEYVL